MTRTNPKYTRIYVNGYDISGVTNKFGNMGFEKESPKVSTYSDDVVNTVLGMSQIMCGPLDSLLSPSDTTGLFELLQTADVQCNVLIALGTTSIPVVGNPCFGWTMQQSNMSAKGDGIVGLNITFPDASYNTIKGYGSPFGLLVHAKGQEEDVNTAVATIDNGAATSLGGIFFYQLFTSDGTVTLSLEHASTNSNGSFSALTGATSGSLDATSTPASGMVALSNTLSVNRYIRWQISLGTATAATFALGFIRGF